MTVNSESLQFNRILRRTIFWPVALIVLIGLFLAYVISELFAVSKSAESSLRILAESRICEKQMVDMETGLRGYLLTNDPQFLQPYHEAMASQEQSFSSLLKLVSDDPDQATRAKTIIQLKNTWIADAEHRLNLHNNKVQLTPDYYLFAKNFMDGLRHQFDDFNNSENQSLQSHFYKVYLLKRVMSIGSLLLLLLLILLLTRHLWIQLTDLASLYRKTLAAEYEKNQELTRAQTELFKQKEWFRVTLSSIGDAVIVTDQEGKVLFLNKEAERLSGWTQVEAMLLPLKHVFQIINEETRAVVENPVEKVYREKKVVGLANHTVLIAKDHQSECAIEDSAAPIYGSSGEVLGVVLVFHDASASRHAEYALREHSEVLEKLVKERTFKLQKALSEMETFSFTVSHDLRSPLRAMQGYAQAVLEDFGDKLNDEGRRYLQRITQAAERLVRLIQDLLSYTRISRDETTLVPVELDSLMRDMITQYANLHEARASITIDGSLPRVLGRESAVTQIFSNLLGNAAKFVNEGVLPQIKIFSEDKGTRVRIWVEDNGIGIAQNNHERIFKMFEQLNNSSLYYGTGVGLAIVKKAVENMRGNVGLESEFGQGSRFWVELEKAL